MATSPLVRYGCLSYIVVTIMLIFFDGGTLSTLLKQISKTLDIDSTLTGLIASLGVCGVLVGITIFTPLSKKFHRMTLIFTGLAIFSAGAFLCSISDSYGMFVSARIIIGIGMAPIYALQPPVVNDLAPANQKAIWIAVNNVLQGTGITISPLFAAGVYSATGRWQDAFLFESFIYAGTLLIGFIFYAPIKRMTRRKKNPSMIGSIGSLRASFGGVMVGGAYPVEGAEKEEKEGSDEDREENLSDASEREGLRAENHDEEHRPVEEELTRSVLTNDYSQTAKMPLRLELIYLTRNRVFMLFLVGMITSFYSGTCFLLFVVDYMERQFNMGVSEAAHVVVIMGSLSGYVATPIGAIIYERLIKRREVITRQYRCQIACAILFFSYLSTTLIALPCTIWQTKWVFIVGAVTSQSMMGASSAINTLACINSVPEENVNTAMSMNVASYNMLGTIPAPILFGVFSKLWGWHNAMIINYSPLIVASVAGFFTWVCSCAPGYTFANQWKVFCGKTTLEQLKSERLLAQSGKA